MEKVKASGDFIIFKRRDGRYAVKNKAGKIVNGVEKIEILVKEKLITAVIPKAKEEEKPAEEAPATDGGEEAKTEATEEASAA